jgi:hypothetical protein
MQYLLVDIPGDPLFVELNVYLEPIIDFDVGEPLDYAAWTVSHALAWDAERSHLVTE